MVNCILVCGSFTFPVNKTDPLFTVILVSAIKLGSFLNIKLDIFVLMIVSFNAVPIPFSLEAAPNENIPTVPTRGAHD